MECLDEPRPLAVLPDLVLRDVLDAVALEDPIADALGIDVKIGVARYIEVLFR